MEQIEARQSNFNCLCKVLTFPSESIPSIKMYNDLVQNSAHRRYTKSILHEYSERQYGKVIDKICIEITFWKILQKRTY